MPIEPSADRKTVLLCTGTRPEIIKMAPVYRALRHSIPGLKPLLLHTGQHDRLAGELYDFFGIQPDHTIALRRDAGSLGHLSARLLEGLDRSIGSIRPDAVLVQGDTCSAAMAALAAFYHKIPVGHVEAGLRTHCPGEPFPEEKNREIIARVAAWHFVPTVRAGENLRIEGIGENVFQVGNTIVDAMHWASARVEEHAPALLQDAPFAARLPTQGRRLVLVTAHRRESWGGRIAEIAHGVGCALRNHPDVTVIWPCHPNPEVRLPIQEVVALLPPAVRARFLLTRPLNYPEMLWVFKRAWLALTDSGGIQEEAVSFNLPVLILRDTTERPEVVEAGGGALIGTRPDVIESWVRRLTEDRKLYESMRHKRNPFGDGHAAELIADILARRLFRDDAERTTRVLARHA